MKCIITGIKPNNYTNKNGKEVKGYNLYMQAENPDVFGRVPKECFIDFSTPLYYKNSAIFDDVGNLEGMEVNAEWDVETYGTKQVKRLIFFEFTGKKFNNFVECVT